ncbi:MAG: right-handed parallel beta-helix repeat-containing protein [Gemmatales bacterium]
MMNLVSFLKVSQRVKQAFHRAGQRQQKPTLNRKSYRPGLEALEDRTVPTTYTVNSFADNNAGSGTVGDLRYVINQANANNDGTTDTIQFSDITLTSNQHTIFVGGGAAGKIPLPAIKVPVVIDGTTADGYYYFDEDCQMDLQTGQILYLDGSKLGSGNGFVLQGGNATVQGLGIANFPGNGILVTSDNNLIGGDTVGYTVINGECVRNNPTGHVTTTNPPSEATKAYVRPPLGNVISGNGGDGVRLQNGADSNLLEGNFIGTDATGLKARGNHGNGVTIINSDDNQLLGTVPLDGDNPFVFYNVISGNWANGLQVHNSDRTIIYANFFGLGADNATPVGNKLDGVLISGNSDRTRFGLNIPLGNVASANGKNGVEVRDHASRTLLMNTFGGIAAFDPSATVPNQGDGILVTSDGGGKYFGTSNFSTLIVTCQLSGNIGNGLEIAGNAGGVQVSQSVIGMETNGATPEPNRKNGIQIGGYAANVSIGGFEPSVAGGSEFPEGTFPLLEAANLISGNLGNGVAVGSRTRNIKILNSLIGTNIDQSGPAGNGLNGIYLEYARNVQIGLPFGATADPARELRNVIAYNKRDGVYVLGGLYDSILGNTIHNNARLGIELICANLNQAAPKLTYAGVNNLGLLNVGGTFWGARNTTYQIEIYAGTSSKKGNGGTNLGFITVTTNSKGFGEFNITNLELTDPLARYISATATSPAGNTSMLSS